jgi:hypothetical protein
MYPDNPLILTPTVPCETALIAIVHTLFAPVNAPFVAAPVPALNVM